MHTIYALTNLLNGKSYVGRTGYIDCRIQAHLSGRGKSLLSKAVREYGAHNFQWRVLDQCESNVEAWKRERLYTHLLESNTPEFGYNSPRLFPLPNF